MRLLRHSLARLACGANMVCTQTRSTELGRLPSPAAGDSLDLLDIGGQLVEPTRTSMPEAGPSRIR
jgi:hypothetical protein